MENKSFAVFILTHGRPDNVITYKTLNRCGYTGKVYFIVDNTDKSIEKYIQNFGIENVKIFDKEAMAQKVDNGNNFNNRKVIIHARNASFEIAEELGLKYFIQLDDDYTMFKFRFENKLGYEACIKSLDRIFDTFINFLNNTNIKSIAFSQGGDFIGGIDNGKELFRFSKRKAMNTFFCSTERPFKFLGRINEDVNTYTSFQSKGNLFLTIQNISITQKNTQTNKGGMTDLYLKSGTYIKSFYTVICSPSSVNIKMLNAKNTRLHHNINWASAVPKIINQRFQK